VIALDVLPDEILGAVRVLGPIFALGAFLDGLDFGDQRVLETLLGFREDFLAGLAAGGLENEIVRLADFGGQILDGGGVNVLVGQRRGINRALDSGEDMLGQIKLIRVFFVDGPLAALGRLRFGRRIWIWCWISHKIFS